MTSRGVGTLRYVARRLVQAVPLAAAVVTTAFILIHVAPGDPLLLLAGDGGTPEYYADMRQRFGLDRSLPEQFLRYTTNVVRGEFGRSFSYQRPVFDVVRERLPATLLLGVSALFLGAVAGIGLGLASAVRVGSWLDRAVRIWTATAYALPVFWIGQLLMLGFALHLRMFPVAGMTSPRQTLAGPALALDVGWHLVLPAVTLALALTSVTARVARAGLLGALGEQWAVGVRARGVSPLRLLLRHALPNALVPVVMVIGHQAGWLLSGAALTEVVFAWPGLGRVLLDASLNRDAPLALAVFLTGVATVVVANLVADLLCRLIDPRVEAA